jgi:type III secretion system FlhB-like substrate exporter
MPIYEIEQYELHTTKYRVEANSAGEAIAKLFSGEGEAVDQSQEMIEVANDYGMPADEFPELVRDLTKLGVSGIDDVIPSIRSIDEV